jgi:hypothetical protein
LFRAKTQRRKELLFNHIERFKFILRFSNAKDNSALLLYWTTMLMYGSTLLVYRATMLMYSSALLLYRATMLMYGSALLLYRATMLMYGSAMLIAGVALVKDGWLLFMGVAALRSVVRYAALTRHSIAGVKVGVREWLSVEEME